MKQKKQRGLFDEEFRHRKIESKDPLSILNAKVNWEQFRSTVEKPFEQTDYSQGGRPPFDRLMMFKVLVLQEYYGLSDDQIEFQILDRLSFQKFIGQGLQDTVPDAKTVWLFRQKLAESGIIDKLFVQLAKQLERYGLIGKKGKIVDASFVKVPIQRNSPDENNQINKGETPDWDENKLRQKDLDADWVKKAGQSHFGYKQHVKADVQSKLVTNFEVTSASEHDSQVIDELIQPADYNQPLYADSAYYKLERIEQLAKKGIKARIAKKSYRYLKITEEDVRRNRKYSSKRSRVEHIFGWFKQKCGNMVRGVGIRRVTARITLRLICYNLSRAVFLIKGRKRGLQMI